MRVTEFLVRMKYEDLMQEYMRVRKVVEVDPSRDYYRDRLGNPQSYMMDLWREIQKCEDQISGLLRD